MFLVLCMWDSPGGQGSRKYKTTRAGCCSAGMKIKPSLQYSPVFAKSSDGQNGSQMPSTTEKMVPPLPHLRSLSASHISSVKRVNGNFPSVLGVWQRPPHGILFFTTSGPGFRNSSSTTHRYSLHSILPSGDDAHREGPGLPVEFGSPQ